MHTHKCLGCGFKAVSCPNNDDKCEIIRVSNSCICCDKQHHPWKYNLKDMMRLLEQEITIPHGKLITYEAGARRSFTTGCESCYKAYNLVKKYKQQKEIVT